MLHILYILLRLLRLKIPSVPTLANGNASSQYALQNVFTGDSDEVSEELVADEEQADEH